LISKKDAELNRHECELALIFEEILAYQAEATFRFENITD
jgi:hypothetical protein